MIPKGVEKLLVFFRILRSPVCVDASPFVGPGFSTPRSDKKPFPRTIPMQTPSGFVATYSRIEDNPSDKSKFFVQPLGVKNLGVKNFRSIPSSAILPRTDWRIG